jgi:hypothetical protein
MVHGSLSSRLPSQHCKSPSEPEYGQVGLADGWLVLVLVEEFDVDLDFREYIIHLSLGGPGDVELDGMDE